MELNSYIWDNVWTDVCCVLSIDAHMVTEISELHWWSNSHRLRYQVVRSWRSSCTSWYMRCTTWVVLNLPWSFLLDLLNKSFDVSKSIWIAWRLVVACVYEFCVVWIVNPLLIRIQSWFKSNPFEKKCFTKKWKNNQLFYRFNRLFDT